MRDWVKLAEMAKRSVEGTAWGRREQALEAVASGVKLDSQTVRRAASALTYLDELAERGERERTLARHLRETAAVGAVEHLSRWSRHDPEGAILAAEGYVKGFFTVRSLAAAEAAARRSSSEIRPTKGRDLRSWIERQLLASLGSAWRAHRGSGSRGAHEPPVDIWLRSEDALLAVLLVGPYGRKAMYGKRRLDWLLRAAGIALVRTDCSVVLVLPPEVDPSAWLDWIDHHALGTRLGIWTLSHGPG